MRAHQENTKKHQMFAHWTCMDKRNVLLLKDSDEDIKSPLKSIQAISVVSSGESTPDKSMFSSNKKVDFPSYFFYKENVL